MEDDAQILPPPKKSIFSSNHALFLSTFSILLADNKWFLRDFWYFSAFPLRFSTKKKAKKYQKSLKHKSSA